MLKTFVQHIRATHKDEYYQSTITIAQRLAEHGFSIRTGGGPGIMETGNRGAALAGAKSIGFNIVLPH